MSHNGSHKRHKNTSGVQLATTRSKARWEPQKAQKHKRGTTGDSQFKGEQGTTDDSQFRGEMGATKGTKTQKASGVQLATASSKIQKHEQGTTGGNPFKGDPNKWRGGLLASCLSPLTFVMAGVTTLGRCGLFRSRVVLLAFGVFCVFAPRGACEQWSSPKCWRRRFLR